VAASKASMKIMHVSLTGLATCFFLSNPTEASKASLKITHVSLANWVRWLAASLFFLRLPLEQESFYLMTAAVIDLNLATMLMTMPSAENVISDT
jgi:hypothetical protein